MLSRAQAERRAAEQYAADLQKQIAREKALAEAEGRIKEARDNEDVNRRAALLKYQEEVRGAWGMPVGLGDGRRALTSWA